MNEKNYDLKISLLFIAVIIIGLFGNMLNMIIFSQKTMRVRSTFRYLFYLSIIDMLVLFSSTTDSLLTYGFFIMIRLKSDILCRFHSFLTLYLTYLKSSILMAVCIERIFVSINQTIMKKKSILKKRAQKKNILSFKLIDNIRLRKSIKFELNYLKGNRIEHIILFISIILALLNIHHVLFRSLNEIKPKENILISDQHYELNLTQQINFINKSSQVNKNEKHFNYTNFLNENSTQNLKSISYKCYAKRDSIYEYFLKNYWIWIDISFYTFLPSLVLIVSTFIIIYEIKTNRSINSSSTALFSTVSSSVNINNKLSLRTKKRNTHLLIMLAISNLCLIICSLPISLNLITMFKLKDIKNDSYDYNAYFHILVYLNNSFSFLIYFLLSPNYRRMFKRMIGEKENRNYLLRERRNTPQNPDRFDYIAKIIDQKIY